MCRRRNVEQSLRWTNEGVVDKSGHRVSEGTFRKSLEMNHPATHTSQVSKPIHPLKWDTCHTNDAYRMGWGRVEMARTQLDPFRSYDFCLPYSVRASVCLPFGGLS